MSVIAYPFNFNEFRKIWKSDGLPDNDDILENLTSHNPLLDQTLRMQGHALAVIDVKAMRYPVILGDVERVCGWPPEYFYEVGVEGYIQKFLPEDMIGLNEFSKHINNYTPTLSSTQSKLFRHIFDYRMYKKDGGVNRVCQESLTLKTNQNGHVTYFMAYVSDITPFKREGKQHLYMTGGNSTQLIVMNNSTNTASPLRKLGNRELEIAKLLGMGLSSEQIAENLSISINTVNTHRQNMLRKLEVTDTTELINFIKIYRLI